MKKLITTFVLLIVAMLAQAQDPIQLILKKASDGDHQIWAWYMPQYQNEVEKLVERYKLCLEGRERAKEVYDTEDDNNASRTIKEIKENMSKYPADVQAELRETLKQLEEARKQAAEVRPRIQTEFETSLTEVGLTADDITPEGIQKAKDKIASLCIAKKIWTLEDAGEFSSGLAAIVENTDDGNRDCMFINTKGEIAFPKKWCDIRGFHTYNSPKYGNLTMAYVCEWATDHINSDKAGLIDTKGNYVVKPFSMIGHSYWPPFHFNYVEAFGDYLGEARDPVTKLFGLVDLMGNWIVKPQYYYINVREDGKIIIFDDEMKTREENFSFK